MRSAIFLSLHNLMARRMRSALTLLGIVLGVAIVQAVQMTNVATLDSLRLVFDRASGQAALSISPLNAARRPLDNDILAKVDRQAGVKAAAPALQVRTLLAGDAGAWQPGFSMSGQAEGSFFQLYGVDPELDSQVRIYILSAGRMPRPGKYEVALPEKTAAEKNLRIGQDLALLGLEGVVRLEIVGLLAGEGAALLNDGAVAFAPLEAVQEAYGRDGEYDEILLDVDPVIAENPHALERLKTDLSARAGPDAQVAYPSARGPVVSQMLATYQMGLTFFSLIAVFVGAFLIYNAFSMTVVERTREIGMLRAVGMGRRQVLAMVLAEAVLLALAGSAIGLLVGGVLAHGLTALTVGVAAAEATTLHWTVQSVVQSVLVGVGVTMTAALLPGLQAARLSPLVALRSRGAADQRIHPTLWLAGLALMAFGWIAAYRIPWPAEWIFMGGNLALLGFFLGATLTAPLAVQALERLARPLAVALYRRAGAIGSANVRRAVGRTTLTVAALMTALAMIISIESLVYAFETDLHAWIDNALGGDLYVRAPLPMRESFAHQLASVPGVQAVSPARILIVRPTPGTLPPEQGEVQLYYEAIDPTTYRQIGEMEFAVGQGDPQANWSALQQGQAVFVSSLTAERFGLRRDDQLMLLTRRGPQAFTVAAEVVDFGGQGLVIYGTYDDMRRWFNESGVDRFTVQVAPGVSVESVSTEIKSRYQDSRSVSVQTTQAFKDSILNLVEQSFRLFDVLNAIAVLIGALGVINTLTMNVIERTREIGGLRSLGMTRRQTLSMTLAEALTLGVIGGVYGLSVGYLVAQVTITGVNRMAGYDLVYCFSASPYLLSLWIALGVVQFAAILPARRAAHVNIVEAIKHE